jgi:predicted transcriptional regulator
MWTVIYIAPSAKMAEKIQDRLVDEGFLVKVRQSQNSKQFEVLVPEGELEEVKEALSSILQ